MHFPGQPYILMFWLNLPVQTNLQLLGDGYWEGKFLDLMTISDIGLHYL